MPRCPKSRAHAEMALPRRPRETGLPRSDDRRAPSRRPRSAACETASATWPSVRARGPCVRRPSAAERHGVGEADAEGVGAGQRPEAVLARGPRDAGPSRAQLAPRARVFPHALGRSQGPAGLPGREQVPRWACRKRLVELPSADDGVLPERTATSHSGCTANEWEFTDRVLEWRWAGHRSSDGHSDSMSEIRGHSELPGLDRSRRPRRGRRTASVSLRLPSRSRLAQEARQRLPSRWPAGREGPVPEANLFVVLIAR